MSRRTSLLPLLSVIALAGCSQPGDEPPALPYFDLARSVETAGIERQTGEIPIGRRAGKPYLLDGWYEPELDSRRERPFVWSQGKQSTLRVSLLEGGPQEIRFEARPFAHDAERPQTITVLANGVEIGIVQLRRKVRPYRLRVPGEALRPGINQFSFRYRNVRELAGGDVDSRSLAVAWYGFELAGGPPEKAEPAASAEGSTLLLPYGTQLEYLVRLEPRSELRLERLGLRGGSAPRVELWLETDLDPPRLLGRFEENVGELTLPIPVEEPTPARLIVRAAAAASADERTGVVLERAALWSRDPAQQAIAWQHPTASEPRRPHIFIYLVDTLRADRLGVYGSDRGLSPRLDEFAHEAVVFEHAVGQSSWTRASVGSIFTGLWPHAHGAVGRRDRLSDDAVTLAEVLREGGYRTVAFATNPNIDRRFGFAQGFDRYVQIQRPHESPRVTQRVLNWLDAWEDDGKPLFLFVHTVDPHEPYEPPVEFLERYAPESRRFMEENLGPGRRWAFEPQPTDEHRYHLSRLYDAEVAFNDSSFGRFVDELRRRGLYDDSILAFFSDHGEEFYEHDNYGHGNSLFGETLDFPFLLRFPGQREGRRVEMPVQHTDLMPTLLDYVGLPVPEAVEGRSLAPLADPDFTVPPGASGPIYSHLDLDGNLTLSVVDGDWKLIDWRGRQSQHKILLNRRVDPDETQNLAERYPIRTAVMAAMLEHRLAGDDTRLDREAIELDEELERNLKALGYL